MTTISGSPGRWSASRSEHFVPAHARQHEVENHEVDVVAERKLEATFPIGRRLHLIAGEGETPNHEIDDPWLVFDQHQMGHAAILGIKDALQTREKRVLIGG